jgi:hypothetical protein
MHNAAVSKELEHLVHEPSVRGNVAFSVESQGARALLLEIFYGVFHEFSVHWTRRRSLFDGPRMRDQ